MEYLESPYSQEEFNSKSYIANLAFLKDLEKEMLVHAVFDHPFLIKFANNWYTEDGSRFILKQFGKAS